MVFDLNKKQKVISKDEILKHYDELEIFRKYINEEIVPKSRPILSPLRKEQNPSFGFFYGEGNEICFNDFKLGKGDFIKFIMLKFGLTYFEALSKIACDFDLQEEYICKKFERTNFQKSKTTQPNKDELLAKYTGYSIGKKRRDWLAHDVLFWQQFGISKKTLEFFNVQPISYIFIDDNIFPADKYAYVFSEVKDGVETFKIYQPYNDKFKWINNHNNSVWQGWSQLPTTGNELIITKSLKDVMSLYEVCNIPAIALQSENIVPKRHVFDSLKSRFKTISLLYDNDFDSETNWGKIFGEKLASELGIADYYIDDKFQCKDFSDLVKNYGKIEAEKILMSETLLPF